MEQLRILGVRETQKALYVDAQIQGKGLCELYVSKRDPEVAAQFQSFEGELVLAHYEMGIFDRRPYVRFTRLELVV